MDPKFRIRFEQILSVVRAKVPSLMVTKHSLVVFEILSAL